MAQTTLGGKPATQTNTQNAPIIVEAQDSGAFLPEGQYRGTIVGMVPRPTQLASGENVTYVDLTVRENVSGSDLRVGYPLKLTPRSDFGALWQLFGNAMPKPGTQVDISAALIGQPVAFSVFHETNEDGTFSRIRKGTLRPVS
jgi:hypothetical protein